MSTGLTPPIPGPTTIIFSRSLPPSLSLSMVKALSRRGSDVRTRERERESSSSSGMQCSIAVRRVEQREHAHHSAGGRTVSLSRLLTRPPIDYTAYSSRSYWEWRSDRVCGVEERRPGRDGRDLSSISGRPPFSGHACQAPGPHHLPFDVTRLFAFAVALRRRRRRLRPAHKHDVNGSNFVPCLPSSCPAGELHPSIGFRRRRMQSRRSRVVAPRA